MRRMEIEIAGLGRSIAELDNRNPLIADALWSILPIEAQALLWGEEVYFDVPLSCEDENPSPQAVAGDISYWSPGHAICIFFGRTQPYSPVNHIGRISDGLEIFRNVKEGMKILLKRI